MTNNAFSLALALTLSAAPLSAAPLEELENLAASPPETAGRVFDNAANRGALQDPTPQMTQRQLRQLLLTDLDSLRNVIAARYAPAGWKGELNGWNLDAEIAKAKAEVAAMPVPSVKEYQKIVARLLASTQDYHVSIAFQSTEMARLPLAITESGGKFYIAGVNRKALPENVFPFKTGDEITSFGGKDINAAIDEYLAAANMHNVPGTDRAMAAMRLTVRAGQLGNDVPQGPLALGIRPAGAAEPVVYNLSWAYTPELIPPQNFVARAAGVKLPFDWLAVIYSDLRQDGGLAAGYGIGDREGFLPDLGEKVWQAPATSLFRAYIYKNPADGRRTAYVRIPTYLIDKPADYAKDFAKLAAEFQSGADALVIDQLNNPGGIVPYMYELLATLTDRPLAVPKHRITLTPEDVASAIRFLQGTDGAKTDADAKTLLGGDDMAGYPITLDFLNGYRAMNAAIVKQWGEGKTLTDPIATFGMDMIPPAYGPRYTKPILLLTNELDVSCGDFFPAIMQDNKRATLFGARTSGAGGAVREFQYPNSLLGIASYHLTGTIAIRPGGQPIESLGVTPDLPYAMRPGDIQQGFRAYIAAVNAAAAGLR